MTKILFNAQLLTDLSPRQQRIVRLPGRGFSNKEVATELEISVGTLKIYTLHLMQRLRHLGLDNRFKVALWGLEQDGFLSRLANGCFAT